MAAKFKRAFIPLALACALLACLTAILPLTARDARVDSGAPAIRLTFVGECSADESPLRLPCADGLPDAAHTLRLYGRLSGAPLPRQPLILYVQDLRLTLSVNGEVAFRYEPSDAEGDAWVVYEKGVCATDELELTLTSAYGDLPGTRAQSLLDHLWAGSEAAVYRGVFLRRGWRLALGAAAALVGVAVAVVALYIYHSKLSHLRRDLYIGGFLLAAGLWFILDGQCFPLLFPYPALVRRLRALCLCAMPLLLMRYVLPLTTDKRFKRCWLTLLGAMALFVLLAVLQIAGAIRLSAQTPYILLAIFLSTGFFAACLLRECALAPEKRRVCVPFFILFIGFTLDAACYLLRWTTLGDVFAAGFVAYATLQIAGLMRSLRESVLRTRNYAKLEGELAQSRISVMLSQIKPHFLFNTLNTISALCLTDPLLADQAITSLSNYLRGNIRSLEQSAPVPFLTELDQIKYYARLEQMRFGEKLRVVYSIGFSDFLVPTLSLQTLVENAIRHGLGPKKEGGTVLLITERVGDEAVVRIIDDGVGFGSGDRSGETHTSIGLRSAEERLQYMVGGTLSVESDPGKGSTLTIRIPLHAKEEP